MGQKGRRDLRLSPGSVNSDSLSEGVTVSGVRRTKVRDARECLSVLRIKLRKKIQKREGDKKKTLL